jgi:MFS family permease
VNHSYEGLDRAGGLSRVRILSPLRHPVYRLLLGGLSVSLLGDGVFLVALAWQVYSLSDTPAALGTVGIAMTVPTIVCLLLGGAVSDRVDRRAVMLAADLVRALAMGTLAGLALAHALTLIELDAVAVVYGAATAFFDPASDALVPELLPADVLAQANSLDQLVRPLALRLAGPALGGALVAVVGSGGAFVLDAVSFLASAGALLAIGRGRATRSAHPPANAAASAARAPAPSAAGMTAEIAAGLRYVRRHPWLWATLASAAIAYLLFLGPTEVLLPFVVRNRLHAGPGALGLVFAAGGVASLVCAVAVGQRGLPRRTITFMYVAWALATVAVAGYGLAPALWGLMVASIAFNALETAGTIAWITLKQAHVPAALLGRVSSLDWLISIGLLPLSYALTGPVSAALGPGTVLIGAGLIGGLVTIGALFVPGVRALDRPALRLEVTPATALAPPPLVLRAPRSAPRDELGHVVAALGTGSAA